MICPHKFPSLLIDGSDAVITLIVGLFPKMLSPTWSHFYFIVPAKPQEEPIPSILSFFTLALVQPFVHFVKMSS